MNHLEVRRLGLMAYADALSLQRALVEERRAGAIPDVLLLVEHPPVLTLGVRGDGGRSLREQAGGNRNDGESSRDVRADPPLIASGWPVSQPDDRSEATSTRSPATRVYTTALGMPENRSNGENRAASRTHPCRVVLPQGTGSLPVHRTCDPAKVRLG